MIMTVLRARDIANNPDKHSQTERRDAFKALLASAEKNKDRARAVLDQHLAKGLYLTIDRIGSEL